MSTIKHDIDTYKALPYHHQRVLQLGILLVTPNDRIGFVNQLVSMRLLKNEQPKNQKAAYNKIIDELIAKGFYKKNAIVLNKDLHLEIAKIAATGPDAADNIVCLKKVKHYRTQPKFETQVVQIQDVRALQLVVLRNDPTILLAANPNREEDGYICAIMNQVVRLFPHIPLDFAKTLDPAWQLIFCLIYLSPVGIINPNFSPEAYVAWIEYYRSQNFESHIVFVTYLKAQLDIALGNIEQARGALSHTTPPSLQDEENYMFYYLTGSLLVLQGRADAAIPLFKKGTTLQNRKLNLRNWCCNELATALYILALLQTKQPTKAEKLKEMLVKHFEYRTTPLFAGIYGMVHYQNGHVAYAKNINKFYLDWWQQPVNNQLNYHYFFPLGDAFLMLALYFIDIELCKEKFLTHLENMFERHKHYTLAGHIYAEILTQFTHKQVYQDFLHTSPYQAFRFTALMYVKLAWENAFDQLAAVLVPQKRAIETNKEPAQKRILWVLNPDDCTLEVVEQTKNAKGLWTQGRLIALRRIYNDSYDTSHCTPQDMAALAGIAIDHAGWYRNKELYFFSKEITLPALVGHPNIVHNKNRNVPIELGQVKPGIHIDAVEGGYRFTLSHRTNEPRVLLEQETQNRYNVIVLSETLARLSISIPQDGLMVPEAGKERVMHLLDNINANDIQIYTTIESASMQTIPAQTTCCMHLFPMGDGLKINLGIRPFGDFGPFCKPGNGTPILFATKEDPVAGKQQLRTERNFDAETESVHRLLAHCSILSEYDTSDYQWQLEDPEICLEALTELNNYKEVVLEWPQGIHYHIKQVIDASNVSLTIRTSSHWFEYDGEVRLNDDQVISIAQLIKALEESKTGRFIQLNNGQFIGLTASLKKRLEGLNAIAEGNKIFHLGSGILDSLTDEVGNLKVDQGWQDHVKRIRAMAKHTPKVPSTLQAKLRTYQEEGFQYLSRLTNWQIGACLADDMGLGKTIQAITLLLEQASKGPALIVAPTSVCFNWQNELAKFAPVLCVASLYNYNGEREELIQKAKEMDVIVCSYGLLNRGIEALLLHKEWHMVVLDEAQAIKNDQTKRWKAITALKAKHRIALTGTPIENRIGELWSIFRFLNPGLLGSKQSFQKRFVTPIEKGQQASTRMALKKLTQPYILRRLKSDVLDELPAKTEQTILVEPSQEEAVRYEALRQQALKRIASLEGNEQTKRFNILAEITKLRQACCDYSLIDPSLAVENTKIKLFIDTLKNLLENNHKALIFSQYVGFLNKIKETLHKENIPYQYLDGQTTAKNRAKAVHAFQSGEGDVFLLSLKAGGTGLNLTAADYVIHLDPWWNPAVEDQASDRAHRIGQKRPVTIYRFIMKNSIEEKIIQMHQEKRNLAIDILDSTAASARMNEAQLMELIQ